MTKSEQRHKAFSSGMKQLSKDSREYIHKLTNILFLVEEPPVCPAVERKVVDEKRKK